MSGNTLKNASILAGSLGLGGLLKKFEQRCADYIGRKYAVACTSATAGLHTSLMVLDVKPDEEVIVPDLTFAAPAFVYVTSVHGRFSWMWRKNIFKSTQRNSKIF